MANLNTGFWKDFNWEQIKQNKTKNLFLDSVLKLASSESVYYMKIGKLRKRKPKIKVSDNLHWMQKERKKSPEAWKIA